MLLPRLTRVAVVPAVALLLGGSLSAEAAPERVWVESAAFEKRGDAVALRDGMLDSGAVDGLQLRVVRRFVQGQGWRHVVQVEGVDDADAAGVIAEKLAAAGLTAQVLGEERGEVRVLARPAPVTPPTAAAPAAAGVPGADGAARILKTAARAHGGARGGLAALEGVDALRFVFERRVVTDDGVLLAANRYYRMGDALRLEVDIVEGTGVDSRTVLTPGNRALLTQGEEAAPQERDPARTREVLARFSPEEVLGVALGFPTEATSSASWQALEPAGVEDCGQARCERLRRPGSAGDPGLVEARIERGTHLLREVRWATASGELRFVLDDYRDPEGDLVVPGSLVVSRDGAEVERIRVLELDVETPLEPGLFDAP